MIVTPGTTIGENTIIGAGSVVTHDIPANVIAAGNPCRAFLLYFFLFIANFADDVKDHKS